ncbi:MAG: desulfoferrodoxin [Eubacteriales bacterium]|nr:desulfoferrodoxin [Eubacteriales bacterium]
MTNYGDYYHCEICGHVVSIVQPGMPTLVCCGQKMNLLEAKTEDTGKEKHVPVIVPDGDMTTIKVGGVPHPMTEEHHIVFIEVVTKDGVYSRAKLNPTGKPEAAFNVKAEDIDAVYEYCNIHGLWKA